jgi:spore coat polysaccharide biosynthesis protein SpsF
MNKPCVAIIQARMGSSRLPGKVLADIEGKPMLQRVVERVAQAGLVDQVVVAATLKAEDSAIAELCHLQGFPLFRGDEFDVLDRYYEAAHRYEAKVIVRITSDCPLTDPHLIDRTIQALLDRQADYASNTLSRQFPRGLDVEVMTAKALDTAWNNAKSPHQRVHVTPYFFENPHRFVIASVDCEESLGFHRWTVDTKDDLELVRTIFRRVGSEKFEWRDVLRLFSEDSTLIDINKGVRQKALEEC